MPTRKGRKPLQLDEKTLARIVAALEAGANPKDLAPRFGVSAMTLIRVRKMLREHGAMDAPAKPAPKKKSAAAVSPWTRWRGLERKPNHAG